MLKPIGSVLAAVATRAKPHVNTDISDLFFNHDLSHCYIEADATDEAASFEESKLRQEAEWFLSSLERLGVPVPTVDDLLADFYART